MKKTNTTALWLYGIGILIVLLSHTYLLVAGLPQDQIVTHSIVNLVAVVLLAWGWVKQTK